MRVSKKAWHYRFYRFMSDGYFHPKTTNLCKYFWRVMWGMLLASLALALATTIVTCISVAIYQHPLAALGFAIGVAIALGVIIMVYYLYCKLDDRRYKNRHKVKELGLVRAYLKAKKDKACPIITFEEEKVE